MQTSTLPLAIAGAVIAIITAAVPVRAQNIQSWVSATGGGSACTRAAPCSTFVAANSATLPGGVISVLDSGHFGTIIISKSLTIRAEGVDGGGTTSSPGFIGPLIFVSAGASDVVRLEGLNLTGAGIVFDKAGQLHVRNCVIGRTDSSSGSFNSGIRFAPNGASTLVVSDTMIVNNGVGATGAGILVNPQAGGSARVHLERVSAQGNVFGIVADGTGSTAGINMTVADSVSSGNTQDGIIAVTPSGGAPIGVYVKNTKSTNNAIGIRSIGPNVTVRVDGSSVIGNGTGLSFSGGGALLSAGNNTVEANGSNGAFSSSYALK